MKRFVQGCILISLIATAVYAIHLALTPAPTGVTPGDAIPISQTAIRDFSFDEFKGTIEDIPVDTRKLEGKWVRFDCTMWQPHSSDNGNMTSFYAAQPGTFHSFQPKPPRAQDVWECRAMPGEKLEYWDGRVRATGVFHVQFAKDEDTNRLVSVFEIDVKSIENLAE